MIQVLEREPHYNQFVGGFNIQDLARAKQGEIPVVKGVYSNQETSITAWPGYLCLALREDRRIHFVASLKQDSMGRKLITFNYRSLQDDQTRHPDFYTKSLIRYVLDDFSRDFGEIDGINFMWQPSSTSNYKPYKKERDKRVRQYLDTGLDETKARKLAMYEAAQYSWDLHTFTNPEFGFSVLNEMHEEGTGENITVHGLLLKKGATRRSIDPYPNLLTTLTTLP